MFAAGAMLPALFAAETTPVPFGTIPLNGGRIEPVRMTMIESSPEHLNFCFAHQFEDGSIYLSHSAGVHTVTEYGCRDHSLDGGKTWQRTDPDFGGFNAYTTREGEKANVSCWAANVSNKHKITRKILSADGKSVRTETSEITLPFEADFRLHRDICKTRDGRLLLTGYCILKGEPKRTSFVIESKDDGKTWNYLATLLRDEESKTPEGPNEAAVIELANGDLLAVVRVGGTTPLIQLRSTDGGKSWQNEGEIAPFCVAPSMRILENGALLIITGRPNLYLLVDFTGTGKNYQKVQLYNGSGSSYASVLEIAPNEIMVIYDESDFGSWRNPGIFSRIMAMTLKVIRDDNAKLSGGGDWIRYSPALGMLPEQTRLAIPSSYQQKVAPEDREAWYELRSVPERPGSVLHMVHHGTGSKQSGTQWATLRVPFSRGTDAFSLEADLRVLDEGEKRPQFAIRFGFESSTGSGSDFGWVAIGLDGISYRDGKNVKVAKYPIGTKFHKIRLSGSLASKHYSLWIDGAEKPLFTAPLAYDKDVVPGLFFGDGSTTVFGSADLADIAWKYSE